MPLALIASLLLFLFQTSQDFIADGAKALDAHQPEAAEALFRQAIAADPKDYLPHFDLALALAMQNKDADAVTELRKTLEIKPGLYEAEINLGMILLRDRLPAEAAPVLKEAVDAKPGEARPNSLYGDALLQTGNPDEAERHYRIANDQDGLARIAAERQRIAEEARLAAVRAKEAEEKPFNDHMDRGKKLRDDHKYAEAAVEYLAAARLHPDAINAWRELAAVYVINKDFPEGLAALDRLKALGDETPGDLYFRAISLDSLHQKKPALDAYRRFLAVAGGKYPDDEFKARQRARILENELKR